MSLINIVIGQAQFIPEFFGGQFSEVGRQVLGLGCC
jgi:hypothetical protein